MKNRKSKSAALQSILNWKRQGFTIATLALVIVVVLAASYGITQIMEQRAHSSAEKLVSQVVDHINVKTGDVEEVTREIAVEARKLLQSPDALEQLVRDFVKKTITFTVVRSRLSRITFRTADGVSLLTAG